MQEVNELCETIAAWHSVTFPDARMNNQLYKLEEECKEATETEFHDVKEIADIFIVSASLWKRYDSKIGLVMIQQLLQTNDFDELKKVVNDKMFVNKNRKWIKAGEVYRHEGE